MPSDKDVNIRIETGTSKAVSRWADAAMFRSEPMPTGRTGPSVTLLNATPDPLGSLAALMEIYTGGVVRNLSAVSDDARRTAYTEVTKNKLQGPLEVVQFHFLVEGVTRSFTHQMVRQREAFFAQESLRFAVPEEDWADSNRVPYPPSVAGDRHKEAIWDAAVKDGQGYYEELIESGVPAEDARGLMPHSILTRLHWVTDLRGLLYVAGLRLCTQAQFEWRVVMAQVVKALRGYSTTTNHEVAEPWSDHSPFDAWQFELIADSLRPICYQEVKCGFKAKMDRPCSIRERVDANERVGRPSEEWGQPWVSRKTPIDLVDTGLDSSPDWKIGIEAIHPYEWAADPAAARRP